MTILVRKERFATENGATVRLRYALTKRWGEWGVEIRADRDGQRETAACQRAADSFREGKRLLSRLRKGRVTPVSLPDILADRREMCREPGKNLDKFAAL